MYRVKVDYAPSVNKEFLTLLKLCRFLGGKQKTYSRRVTFYFEDEEAVKIFTEALDARDIEYRVDYV